MNNEDQQDCSEYLVGLLRRLQEAEQRSNGESFIRSLLYGEKTYTYACNHDKCTNASVRVDQFTVMSLPIQGSSSVYSAIKKQCKSESVDWKCEDQCFEQEVKNDDDSDIETNSNLQ